MAIGLSLEEVDLLLNAIVSENTPLAKLLRHRLWDLHGNLVHRMLLSGDVLDRMIAARLLHVELESEIRLVTE